MNKIKVEYFKKEDVIKMLKIFDWHMSRKELIKNLKKQKVK